MSSEKDVLIFTDYCDKHHMSRISKMLRKDKQRSSKFES